MKILDILVNELNEALPEDEKKNGNKWELLHSQKYKIKSDDQKGNDYENTKICD